MNGEGVDRHRQVLRVNLGELFASRVISETSRSSTDQLIFENKMSKYSLEE